MSEAQSTNNFDVENLALQIISYAGEGKAKVREAVEVYCQGDETGFDALMKGAEDDFLQAHRAQIDYLQHQVVDEQASTPILLVHAMDILMNAMGEQDLVMMLVKMIQSKDRRQP